MFFHQYQDVYSYLRRVLGKEKLPTPESYYEPTLAGGMEKAKEDPRSYLRSQGELHWWHNGRPYYNLWPAITPTLLGIDLSRITLDAIHDSPMHWIAVQFPLAGFMGLRAMVAGMSVEFNPDYGKRLGTLTVYSQSMTKRMDLGPGYEDLKPPWDVEWHCKVAYDLDEPVGELEPVLKLAAAIFLLEHDPQIIKPDVLKSDEQEFSVASPERQKELIAKALARRGQPGFHIGKDVEAIPHYRRPHPALYWTGEGRRIPKIVFRSGAVVHRQKMTEVPTGFHGSPGEEVT